MSFTSLDIFCDLMILNMVLLPWFLSQCAVICVISRLFFCVHLISCHFSECIYQLYQFPGLKCLECLESFMHQIKSCASKSRFNSRRSQSTLGMGIWLIDQVGLGGLALEVPDRVSESLYIFLNSSAVWDGWQGGRLWNWLLYSPKAWKQTTGLVIL